MARDRSRWKRRTINEMIVHIALISISLVGVAGAIIITLAVFGVFVPTCHCKGASHDTVQTGN